MQTSYQINAADLTADFVTFLKTTYKNKYINISVSEMDETDYLLSNPINKKILLQRIEDIKNGENIVTPFINNSIEYNYKSPNSALTSSKLYRVLSIALILCISI